MPEPWPATPWCGAAGWIAEAEIKRRGPVVKTEGGNIIQNPFLAVANKCLAQMAQLENEFGLTPSSRSRIRMAEPADQTDPFEDYLNHGKNT
jgi:P27 family predicted phage terminase small subunit